MSVVFFASVVRVRDGLPLSASTDYEHNQGVQQSKKLVKRLSKKLDQFPDRCTLKNGPHTINFISSLGVGYMMLCSENYPSVLSFCFLDELQKEFITTYDTARMNTAIRPYSFIEFDNCIQKTKQRYNNPRSLSTKINLADMQTEIKLRPPYQISMGELGPANGFSHKSAAEYKAPHQRLEPVTLAGIISVLLSLLCGALNLIRSFHAIESLVQVPRLQPIDSTRILSAVKSRTVDAPGNIYMDVIGGSSLDAGYHGGGFMELVVFLFILCLTLNLLINKK
ncbi:vesicle-trafficking protein SEC22a isoform X2 [Pleurodeles waltl]|uniref:vesicle-trafficking protein SEC22a isoform X2 n=1 Tax=Pleurodeles waltl TaxID=8319 RepID=UPI003709BE69